MTRNPKKYSSGVILTVDGSGNVQPKDDKKEVNRGGTIVIAASSETTRFIGRVCARQGDQCKCTTVVGVSSDTHMEIGTAYAVSLTVSVASEFEICAVTDSEPVPNTTNGKIRVGG
jgi:hypothetical protein